MEILKLILFLAILCYAAIVDIKKMTVPTHVHILLIAVGCISCKPTSFIGAAMTFLPFFIVALINPCWLGGGDVKLAAGCGFVLGGFHGLLGLVVGLTLAIIFVPVWQRLRKAERNMPFGLVPFFFIGNLLYILILKG